MKLSIAQLALAFAALALVTFPVSSSVGNTVDIKTSAHELPGLPPQGPFEALDALWAEARTVTKLYVDGDFYASYKLAEAQDSVRNPFFAYWLGRMLLEGKGVEKNRERGIDLLGFAEKQGVGSASLLLCQAYAEGKLTERNVELARIHQLRWIDFEIAHANYRNRDYSLIKTLFDRERASAYRFWQQRLTYMQKLRIHSDFHSLRQTLIDPVKPSTAVMAGALPLACRPPAPPRQAMLQLKVDVVVGDVYFFVDSRGRVDGMALGEITEPRLTLATMRLFDIALRNESCVLPPSLSDQLVQIPFKFRLE